MAKIKSRNLVLIEDDVDDRYLIRSVFEEVKLNVVIEEFDQGNTAMESLCTRVSAREPLPQLILLDLNMPVFDGFKFLEARRKEADLCSIPVLVYTTSSSEEDVLRSYTLGANAYLVKPLSYPKMRKMLTDVCRFWFEVARLPQPSPTGLKM